MTCENVQLDILRSGEAVSPRAREHLTGCEACRDFAAFAGRVCKDPTSAEPAPELDAAVLEAARRELTGRCAPNVRLLRLPVLLFGGRLPAVAAAVAVLLAVAAVLMRPPHGSVEGEGEARQASGPAPTVAAGTPGADPVARETAAVGPEMPSDLDEPLFKLEVELFLEMERFSVSSVSDGRF